MIESLPPRPLSMDEAETLSEGTEGKLLPDPYLDLPERGIAGFVGMVFLSSSAVKVVGFDPDDSEWSVIRTQDTEEPVSETYDHLDEWVEETYGVGV